MAKNSYSPIVSTHRRGATRLPTSAHCVGLCRHDSIIKAPLKLHLPSFLGSAPPGGRGGSGWWGYRERVRQDRPAPGNRRLWRTAPPLHTPAAWPPSARRLPHLLEHRPFCFQPMPGIILDAPLDSPRPFDIIDGFIIEPVSLSILPGCLPWQDLELR